MKFNPHVNLKKVIATLEKVAANPVTPQAAVTLGELYYIQSKKNPDDLSLALKYYEMGAKMGCGYGEYWVGYLTALIKKDHKAAHEYFTQSYRKGNINASYQLFLLYSKAPEYLDVKKAYRYLRRCELFGMPCHQELNEYFKAHLSELKDFDESWKEWPDESIVNIHEAEMVDVTKKFVDAKKTDTLYKRPSEPYIDNNGNWFLTMQAKSFVKQVIHYPWEDFVVCLKEELLPVFSSVGLLILDNWRVLTKAKAKDTKEKQETIERAMEFINIYISEGMEELLRKFKRYKKKEGKVELKPRIRYFYMDYIHPSYFKSTEKEEIACNYCKKPQGTTKLDMCSACKKVYYCSKDCQVKDWKSGHKTQCPLLKETT